MSPPRTASRCALRWATCFSGNGAAERSNGRGARGLGERPTSVAHPTAMEPEVREKLARVIQSHDVILFMKGTRQMPSCGFSAKTVEILDSLLDDYAHVDVLAHPEIREGIKEYSSWPTIPQLYVHGKFIGGADIVAELFEAGTLAETLGVSNEQSADVTAPAITVTPRAAEALRGFVQGSDEVVLLSIDRAFSPGLSVGPRPLKGFLVQSSGVAIAVDRLSAVRANGITIDYIDTPSGSAFKIDNPNEPKRSEVRQLGVRQYASWRADHKPHRLIDVRTQGEWQTARIEGAEFLDDALVDEIRDLPRDTVLVFQCHHGHRSQRAAEQLIQLGFSELYNLTGGIDAWSQEVDPAVPRY